MNGHFTGQETDESQNYDVIPDGTNGNESSPDRIRKSVTVARKTLPDKSKKRYADMYKKFEEWRTQENVQQLSEEVLLTYFEELAKKNCPTTLWAIYSMLKSTIKHHHNIDISRYSELINFVKQRNKGYRPVKTNVFTDEQVAKFLSEAPDEEYLVHKVCSSVTQVSLFRVGSNKSTNDSLLSFINRLFSYWASRAQPENVNW